MEDRSVKLGCVMPGESPSVFGDALRRMSSRATYLYHDGGRYWYSTQPTVTKLAEDRAEQLKRDPDAVVKELDQRLRDDLRQKGEFSRVHPLPQTGQDVPDEMDARLVVLGIDHPYGKQPESPAIKAARAIYETKGSAPRLYRNTLAFLAVDQTRLQDLDEAVRRYLAWQSILDERDELDLAPHQVKQAETQKKSADATVTARIPEAYQWLLVPVQDTPQASLEWQAYKLTGSGALAARASRKLRNDELLVTAMAGTRLRLELDRVPLWRGNHVSVKQLAEDFARYHYLPRLKGPEVLVGAIQDGLSLMLWHHESFAYADNFDESDGRYIGLRVGQNHVISAESLPGVLVKPDVAKKQMDAETPPQPQPISPPTGGGVTPPDPLGGGGSPSPGPTPPDPPRVPKRFHGEVELDPTRAGRDASRIVEEVVTHLTGLVGSKVTVSLEIKAEVPGGVPENVVRTVTENARTLKFVNQGFENE